MLFDIFTIWDFVNADFPLLAVLGEGLVESFYSLKTYLFSLQEGTHLFLMNYHFDSALVVWRFKGRVSFSFQAIGPIYSSGFSLSG